jgi:hypothetical protein
MEGQSFAADVSVVAFVAALSSATAEVSMMAHELR